MTRCARMLPVRHRAIPWLIFYQAWTQAQGYERAVLVPRLQLVRRVSRYRRPLNVHSQPDASAMLAGTVSQGDLFEITDTEEWLGENRRRPLDQSELHRGYLRSEKPGLEKSRVFVIVSLPINCQLQAMTRFITAPTGGKDCDLTIYL